jgi:hypothetical protein
MTQAPPPPQRLFECSQPFNHRSLPGDWDTAVPVTPGVECGALFPHAKALNWRAAV